MSLVVTAAKGDIAVCATDTRRVHSKVGQSEWIAADDMVKLRAVRGGWVSAGGCLPVALLGFEALQRSGVKNLSRARRVVADAWDKNVEAIRHQFPHDHDSIELTRLQIVRGGSPPSAHVLFSRGEFEPGGGPGMAYLSHPSDLVRTAAEGEQTSHFAACYRKARTFGDMVRAVADVFRLTLERSDLVSPVIDIGRIATQAGRLVHTRARLGPQWATASDREIEGAFSVFDPDTEVCGATIHAGA